MTTKDYESVFEEVSSSLPKNLRAVMQRPTKEQVHEAVRSKKGFRFFEERLARAVRTLRLVQEAKTPGNEPRIEYPDGVAEQSGIRLST